MKARKLPLVLAVAQGGPRVQAVPETGSGSDASEKEGGAGRHWPHLLVPVHSLESTAKADDMVSFQF